MKNLKLMKIGITFLALACISACGIIPIDVPVRVYNVKNGDILHGTFKWTGAKGAGFLILKSGARCDGEYHTVDNSQTTLGSSTGWGAIYGRGSAGFSTNRFSNSTTIPNSQKGSGILVCPDKTVIQCEYVVNTSNSGSGFCSDSRNNNYRFMF